MLEEIIGNFTDADKNANVTSEQVLARSKRVKAQRAKSVLIKTG